MKHMYQKAAKWLDNRKIAAIIILLFTVSLIPIFYVGFFNYASGDDFWYGIHTYRNFQDTHSLWEALKGSLLTVKEFFVNWQGTWFTMFLFTLQPENFVNNSYWIVVFLSVGLLIIGVMKVLHKYLVHFLNLPLSVYLISCCIMCYLMIQYMPRITSGIYWYNGVAHYTIPFAIAMFVVSDILTYAENYKISVLVRISIGMALLGGGSYLVPILTFLVAIAFMVVFVRKNRKILWLCIPVLIELVGLAISAAAPGNSVRGGEEFGFSLKWVLQTIYYACDRSRYLSVGYFIDNPIMISIFLLLLIVLWEALWKSNNSFKFTYPLLFMVYMFGIYCAMHTPGIYSRSDVSGGVPDTILEVFLLTLLASCIYLMGWIQRKLNQNEKLISIMERYNYWIKIPGFIICILLTVFFSYEFHVTSTTEYCIDFVQSGRKEDFTRVMKEQKRILRNSEIEDAVIPEFYDDTYPIVHMTVTDAQTGERNIMAADYYDKRFVIGVDYREYFK